MRKRTWGIALALLALCLASCQGFTTVGGQTKSGHSGSSGWLEMSHNKANGSTQLSLTDDIEALGEVAAIDDVLEVDVTLAVGKGSFKIELLGKDDEVTLALEAREGETVSGHGQIVIDGFGNAPYRVTAVEAENVDYYMEYTIQ